MSAYVWIVVMVLLFMVTFMYASFSEVMTKTTPLILDSINTGGGDPSMIGNATATINTLGSVWTYWPVMLIFGLIIWAFASAGKRESIAEGGY